jgi:hypothetical protein
MLVQRLVASGRAAQASACLRRLRLLHAGSFRERYIVSTIECGGFPPQCLCMCRRGQGGVCGVAGSIVHSQDILLPLRRSCAQSSDKCSKSRLYAVQNSSATQRARRQRLSTRATSASAADVVPPSTAPTSHQPHTQTQQQQSEQQQKPIANLVALLRSRGLLQDVTSDELEAVRLSSDA